MRAPMRIVGPEPKAVHGIFSSRAGVSLVELIVALGITAMGLFSAIQLYFFSLDRVRTLNEVTVARSLLQNELERLRAAPFEALPTVEALPFSEGAFAESGLREAMGALTIRPYPGLERGLKEVRAEISWRSRGGRRIQRAMTTLLAGRGAGEGGRVP